MDAVRTAQRFTGNPVTILYRRTRHEMPAAEEELEGALEEGNILEELVAPVEVRARRTAAWSACGASATRWATPGPGRPPLAGGDSRQRVRRRLRFGRSSPSASSRNWRSSTAAGVARHEGGGVLVDGATRCAGPEGVYAGGDVVIEPGSIISACADGRRGG